MKRKIFDSMYTRFIALFLGAFLVSIFITGLITYFTQIDNIKLIMNQTIESRANSLKALVEEQNISAQEASNYLTSAELKIFTKDTFDPKSIIFSSQEQERMKNGETIVKIHPSDKILVLGVLELAGEQVFITPDLQNNPITQFKKFQRIAFFSSILLGSLFIIFAVAMVVKPIKKLSTASREVAKGDFNIQVDVKGNDEISDLGRNFNRMVKKLSANEYLHKDFVSNVSHEFKTPITSLIGYGKLLRKDTITADQKKEYADIIISEGERLSGLSSKLLRLSELGNEVIDLKEETIQLDEQIRDAMLLLQNLWENKNLELDLDLPEIECTGDKALLYQVWINLISNAINYSNDNGSLGISLKQTDVIIVEIVDRGIGMTQEEQENIFSRFYKADKSRNTTGTGLGLTIAREIVELHKGTITVESKLGQGSHFFVALPLELET